ncbi:MAG: glutathione S-transferase [Ascidiaceihabitans sp.]|jgi:glutathione S-transferase
MAADNLLITLLPSTDVDLGRWMLQHYEVPFTERPHAPIFHVLALKSWGMGAEEYPLFVQNGKNTDAAKIPTDPQILSHFDPLAAPEKRLFPDKVTEPELFAKVDEIQHFARMDVGNSVVNWSYFNLLKYKSAVWSSITTGVPWYEKLTCLVAFRVIKALMYGALKLDQKASDEALKTIYAGFDKIDSYLADGREYLVGDRLTYADLAVAASLGPMVLAQGYQGFLPNQAACPAYMREVYRELRQRPTGLFVQRMYDQHRQR